MLVKVYELPKRPYKNIEEYILKNRGYDNTKFILKCIYCSGSGKIYDPDDPPDVYEGNKLRNRIRCQHCNGSGLGKLEDWKKEYKNTIDSWKIRRNNEKKIMTLQKSALKKLTKDEMAALGIY